MTSNEAVEQIAVGFLIPLDLGSRVLVTDGDTVVDGHLEGFWTDHGYKRDLKLNHLTVKTDTGEFTLKNIPLDYVIQIDRAAIRHE